MKNILLIGGNGFLGKNIASILSNGTGNIFIYDLVKSRENNKAFFQGDISDISKIKSICQELSITHIIHLASTLIPSSTIEDYSVFMDSVYVSTIKLLEYCSENEIVFIYMSSGGTIYGSKHGCLSEVIDSAPISYYGLSKLQIEEAVLFYHRRFNLDYLILRPSNPYGFGQNLYGKQGLIAVIFGTLLKNESLSIFGDGSSIRDYIYINDFIFYIKELIKKDLRNEIINIGSGMGYTINHVVKLVEKVTERRLNVEYIDSRGNDVKEIVLDISKLKGLIEHKQYSLEAGIRDYYHKLKENTIFV